jgi:hypothetical protein
MLPSEHLEDRQKPGGDEDIMGAIIESHRTIARQVRRVLGMSLVLAALAAVGVGGATASGFTRSSAAHDQYSPTKPLAPAATTQQGKGTAPTVVKKPMKVSGTLPFTGTNLTIAAALGIVLVGAGLLLRLRRDD